MHCGAGGKEGGRAGASAWGLLDLIFFRPRVIAITPVPGVERIDIFSRRFRHDLQAALAGSTASAGSVHNRLRPLLRSLLRPLLRPPQWLRLLLPAVLLPAGQRRLSGRLRARD